MRTQSGHSTRQWFYAGLWYQRAYFGINIEGSMVQHLQQKSSYPVYTAYQCLTLLNGNNIWDSFPAVAVYSSVLEIYCRFFET